MPFPLNSTNLKWAVPAHRPLHQSPLGGTLSPSRRVAGQRAFQFPPSRRRRRIARGEAGLRGCGPISSLLSLSGWDRKTSIASSERGEGEGANKSVKVRLVIRFPQQSGSVLLGTCFIALEKFLSLHQVGVYEREIIRQKRILCFFQVMSRNRHHFDCTRPAMDMS